ncbi:unnamed protein product, partial [Allacma fusca]
RYGQKLKKPPWDGCAIVVWCLKASMPVMALLLFALEVTHLDDSRYWQSDLREAWNCSGFFWLSLILDLNAMVVALLSLSFGCTLTLLYVTVNRLWMMQFARYGDL